MLTIVCVFLTMCIVSSMKERSKDSNKSINLIYDSKIDTNMKEKVMLHDIGMSVQDVFFALTHLWRMTSKHHFRAYADQKYYYFVDTFWSEPKNDIDVWKKSIKISRTNDINLSVRDAFFILCKFTKMNSEDPFRVYADSNYYYFVDSSLDALSGDNEIQKRSIKIKRIKRTTTSNEQSVIINIIYDSKNSADENIMLHDIDFSMEPKFHIATRLFLKYL